MPPSPKTYTINEKEYKWKYSRLRGKARGWCFFSQRKILIDKKAKKKTRLEIEIHEYLHAQNPDMSEEAVCRQGRELADILWDIGYRISSDG